MRNPWKTLIAKAKTAARPGQEKKNGIKRTEPLDVTIDEMFLVKQFSRQNGKCYWTEFPIDPHGVYEKNNPLAPSLERLDESKGYVPDNVVICLRLFNLGRQRCPEKKFKQQVNQLREHFMGKQVTSSLVDFLL
ncbi:hypothetical protein Np050604_021 [Cyanophage S-RIM44]|uniref:Uncharacterized protein n=2 Tax=Vellamovirus TaxID=2733139 RepID=A0A127KMX2_9CAUD|nr:endonuclease [Prochlorococcus phage Syn1]AMO43266.1 hypothetical protein W270710_021 [Cyanophage S-RIM44]ADO99123.1 hypothetical protein Syn1_021 [Prochlorococcus phage Syn1]AOO11738.1 hypothetical protein Np050604_021 [Cyanophage S-RIM44]AOO12439.1 hypothetical protein Sn080709_021 [Cyanophage S-RIM44]AOO12904.1 hypothetical protein W2100709_021 [Cyanophage S-RIM44]